jgi:hypothetical protein
LARHRFWADTDYMQRSIPYSEHSTQARSNGLVIAAIGLQLLLCSLASAAGAAGDSIDRSARRLPAQVAQAFREIAERNSVSESPATDFGPGYRLNECPSHIESAFESLDGRDLNDRWARRLLNLPPPARR